MNKKQENVNTLGGCFAIIPNQNGPPTINQLDIGTISKIFASYSSKGTGILLSKTRKDVPRNTEPKLPVRDSISPSTGTLKSSSSTGTLKSSSSTGTLKSSSSIGTRKSSSSIDTGKSSSSSIGTRKSSSVVSVQKPSIIASAPKPRFTRPIKPKPNLSKSVIPPLKPVVSLVKNDKLLVSPLRSTLKETESSVSKNNTILNKETNVTKRTGEGSKEKESQLGKRNRSTLKNLQDFRYEASSSKKKFQPTEGNLNGSLVSKKEPIIGTIKASSKELTKVDSLSEIPLVGKETDSANITLEIQTLGNNVTETSSVPSKVEEPMDIFPDEIKASKDDMILQIDPIGFVDHHPIPNSTANSSIDLGPLLSQQQKTDDGHKYRVENHETDLQLNHSESIDLQANRSESAGLVENVGSCLEEEIVSKETKTPLMQETTTEIEDNDNERIEPMEITDLESVNNVRTTQSRIEDKKLNPELLSEKDGIGEDIDGVPVEETECSVSTPEYGRPPFTQEIDFTILSVGDDDSGSQEKLDCSDKCNSNQIDDDWEMIADYGWDDLDGGNDNDELPQKYENIVGVSTVANAFCQQFGPAISASDYASTMSMLSRTFPLLGKRRY